MPTTRRSISLRGETYVRLRAYARVVESKGSTLAEQWINEALDAAGAPAGTPISKPAAKIEDSTNAEVGAAHWAAAADTLDKAATQLRDTSAKIDTFIESRVEHPELPVEPVVREPVQRTRSRRVTDPIHTPAIVSPEPDLNTDDIPQHLDF